jgi:hypothetical protein
VAEARSACNLEANSTWSIRHINFGYYTSSW